MDSPNSNGGDSNSSTVNRQFTRKQSCTSSFDKEPERICPRVNCQERIILCLDISDEMEKVSFRSRAGDKFTPIKLMKRALGIFLHSKHKINLDHEFALYFLKDQAYMMHDFTNDPAKLINILEEMENCFSVDCCDLSSLFDSIQQSVRLPQLPDPRVQPPPYIVRTVLFYGRSDYPPLLSSRDSLKFLMTSPYFFLDIFYIHDSPSEDNHCEGIFNEFCELDERGLFYIFEVSRNMTKLYDCMAQLLSHPLQRPIQTDACYRIESKTVS